MGQVSFGRISNWIELNDLDLLSHNVDILNHFDNILEWNIQVLTRFIQNFEEEYAGYENW